MKQKLLLTLLATASLGATAQMVTSFDQNLQPQVAGNVAGVFDAKGQETNLTAASNFTLIPSAKAQAPANTPVMFEDYLMSRNDTLMYISWGTNVAQTTCRSAVGEVLINTDGTFYLLDPFFRQRVGTWLQGQLQDGVVSFTLPQEIAVAQFEDGTSSPIIATVIERDDNTFVPVEGTHTWQFTWDGDSLKCVDPNVKIGMVIESSQAWIGYAEWGMNWGVQRDVPTTYTGYAPYEDYGLVGYSYNFWYMDGNFGQGVKVRYDGDQVILSNLPDSPAGSVVVGQIDGDKVVFPKQYMGIDETNYLHVYFQPMDQVLTQEGRYIYSDVTLKDNYEVEWDEANKVMTAIDDNTFSINCGKDVQYTMGYLSLLHNAEFKPFNPNKPARPANGYLYMYQLGYSGCFSHGLISTDGEYLDPDQTYWRVWANDTLQQLDTEVFTGFDTTEPTVTDIPWVFNNAANLFSFTGNYFHQASLNTGWEKIGFQVVYKAGGQTHYSDVFWSDQTITTVDDEVTGVADVSTQKTLKSVTYFDLSGRQVANPERGIYIMAEQYTDGTVSSAKVVR